MTAAEGWRRLREGAYAVFFFACAFLSILVSLAIVTVLVGETVPFFRSVSPGQFFLDSEWYPRQMPEPAFGIWPLVTGTLLVTGIAALVALPIGLATAVFLSEYASERVRSIVKPTLEVLAGIPTVVYGYFALLWLTPHVIRPIFEGVLGLQVNAFNALSAAVAVGIMIIPMVSSLSEDALRSVPRSLREAAYALGGTKFDVSVRVVVPAATSGIVASFLLAVARAIGETMIVAVAAGQTPTMALNPVESVQTMTAYIVQAATGDPGEELVFQSLFAVALVLFTLTLAMNMLAQWVVQRYREVYE